VWLLIITSVTVVAIGVGNHENGRRIAEIQESRMELCLATNERHDATIRTLDELIRKLPADRRARARENRTSTVALLEAIAPRRDCKALVRP